MVSMEGRHYAMVKRKSNSRLDKDWEVVEKKPIKK